MICTLAELIFNHWLLSACVALGLYLKYATRRFNYWTERGVPQRTPLPLLGTNWFNFFHSYPEANLEGLKSLGKLYGGFNGRQPQLMISDPELIRLVAIKDFDHFHSRSPPPFNNKLMDTFLVGLNGEDWKRVRSVVSPTFSTGKMKRMYPIIDECTTHLLEDFQGLVKSRSRTESVRVRDVFGTFSMDVIARCAFAIKTRDQGGGPEGSIFAKHASSFFTPEYKTLIPCFLLPRWLCMRLGISVLPKEHTDFFTRVTQEVLDERRSRSSPKRSKHQIDYIQLILEASERKQQINNNNGEDQESHVTETAEERQAYQRAVQGSNLYLEDFEITAQSCVFLAAGYEGVSMALTNVTHALAWHPEVQERLFTSLKALADSPEGLTYDVIFTEPYLNAVVNEILRTYPAAAFLERMVTAKYRFPEPYCHVTLDPGVSIAIQFHATHHDPDLWENPEKFDPDRFLPENEHLIKPYSFLPFGVGPRNCVAMRFALLELKLALARLVLRFKFSTTPQTVPMPLRFKRMSMVQRHVEEVLLAVEER